SLRRRTVAPALAERESMTLSWSFLQNGQRMRRSHCRSHAKNCQDNPEKAAVRRLEHERHETLALGDRGPPRAAVPRRRGGGSDGAAGGRSEIAAAMARARD